MAEILPLRQKSIDFFSTYWDGAIGQGVTEDVSGTSIVVYVGDVHEVMIRLEAEAEDNGFDAEVDLLFSVCPDKDKVMSTTTYYTLSFPMVGANPVAPEYIDRPLNVSGAWGIRLDSIVNNDAAKDLTDDTVQVTLCKKVHG